MSDSDIIYYRITFKCHADAPGYPRRGYTFVFLDREFQPNANNPFLMEHINSFCKKHLKDTPFTISDIRHTVMSQEEEWST